MFFSSFPCCIQWPGVPRYLKAKSGHSDDKGSKCTSEVLHVATTFFILHLTHLRIHRRILVFLHRLYKSDWWFHFTCIKVDWQVFFLSLVYLKFTLKLNFSLKAGCLLLFGGEFFFPSLDFPIRKVFWWYCHTVFCYPCMQFLFRSVLQLFKKFVQVHVSLFLKQWYKEKLNSKMQQEK